jgi:hypothetical protein
MVNFEKMFLFDMLEELRLSFAFSSNGRNGEKSQGVHNEPDILKSPLTPLFQRGEFLPLAKGGKEGFGMWCL